MTRSDHLPPACAAARPLIDAYLLDSLDELLFTVDKVDGTYGIIDCKFQAKDSDKTDLYGPQLEAYAYSLENPAVGAGQPVDSMGLLVWNPDHAEADGFKIRQKYVPVPRDTVRFNALVEDLITMLEGDLPSSGVDCPTCKFLKARNALD